MNELLLKDKNFTISQSIIKYIDKDISVNDFLILIYFINSIDNVFDAQKISTNLNISLEEVMNSVNNLINKSLINLEQGNDLEGRIVDIISLDNLYKKVLLNIENNLKEDKKESIFDLIAKEFGKKLSPIDCEIINGWLDIGTSEELIKEALKEASYNGVKTLRYMDKVIYEWSKKNLKTVEDVKKYMSNKNEKNNNQDLFDYDWLDDDE